MKRSLENLPGWLNWFYESCLTILKEKSTESNTPISEYLKSLQNVPVFFCGNKLDKLTTKSILTVENIDKQAAEYTNINRVFQHIVNYIRKKFGFI